MKKTLKIAGWIFGVCLFLFICADLTLRIVSSRKWVRDYVVEKISIASGRQIQLDRVSVSFFGTRLFGLKISEAGGFDKGVFLSAKRLTAGYSLFHLLHKHVVVSHVAVRGLAANVVKNEDGKFNFSDLISSLATQTPAPEDVKEPLDWRISLNHFFMDRASFTYQDAAVGQSAEVKKLFVEMSAMSLRRDFKVSSNWEMSYKEPSLPSVSASGGLAATVNLGALDFSKAFVHISDFTLRYKGVPVVVSGSIANFNNPNADLSVQVSDLSSATLSDFAPEAPEFLISELTAALKADVDTEKENITVNLFSLTMPGTEVMASGSLSYAQKTSYDFHSAFDLDLSKLAVIMPLLSNEYKVSGIVNGAAEVSSQDVTASIALQDTGAFVLQAGAFSAVNGDIALDAAADFNRVKLTSNMGGKLNAEPFKGSLDYAQTKNAVNIVINGSADRVVLPPPAESVSSEPEGSDDAPTELVSSSATGKVWPLPPMNIKTNVWIGSVDAPYFYGTDVSFNTDLTGITPDLGRAHGSVSLSMGNGEIKDLYKLTNANALTKVLFVSLGVVGKVINSLNVFAVLNGIGSGIVSAVTGPDEEKPADMVVQTITGPDGQPMQIMVPFTERKIEGKMVYEKFTTDVNFKDGVANIRRGSFVSDLISFRLDGKTDFKTQKIKMNVHAAPGKHYVDGIMPLTLSIGGTVSQPEGSLSMVGSVSSILTQTVANNFASNTVKKGVGGIFGLFKKKKMEPAVTAVQATPAQEGQSAIVPVEDSVETAEQTAAAGVATTATDLPDGAALPAVLGESKPEANISAGAIAPDVQATPAVPVQ